MRFTSRLRSVVDTGEYWAKWLLLSLFGPATQDPANDPIEQLKRQYGRPPSP